MLKKIAAVLLIGIVMVGVTACAAPATQTSAAQTTGNSPVAVETTVATASPTTSAATESGALTSEEAADLLHMREEEKLARDVYLALYDKWGQRVFKNIASAEQRHMDAVGTLIKEYGLQDPVKETKDQPGVFTDPKLQELYEKLVKEGSESLKSALIVGATIEDLDIKDLNDALARTNKADIEAVYENLKSGSENHMRAFVRNLKQMGADYTPKYITPEEYNEILNGATGRRSGTAGMARGRGHGRQLGKASPGKGYGRFSMASRGRGRGESGMAPRGQNR